MDRIGHEPSKWEDTKHFHMTYGFWGKFGTYKGKQAKHKNLFHIHRRNNKTTKTGNASMKKALNDTNLLLHPS